MKKFKPVMSLLLAATLFASLAGCAPKAPVTPTPAAPAAPAVEAPATEAPAPAAPAAAPVTLKFWFWDNSMEEQYKKMFADFESKNPGIKIDYSITAWGDYWTKLQTALPTGEGPDLFWLNHPNALSYMPTGLITDFTADNLDMSHFEKNLVDPFTYEGKNFGVPIFFDTIVMFYNKTLFDEAGIAYPKRGWTWDEMRDTARKLTKADGDDVSQYGLAFAPGVQAGSLEFVKQNSGRVFSDDRMVSEMNNPEAKEAIQYLLDLKYKDKALAGTEFLQMNQMGELFINNMIAMEVSGVWRVKPYFDALGDQLGIAHLPKKKVEASTYHNLGYASAASSKNKEAVLKFMQYTTTKDHADFVAPVFLPAYKESQPAYFATYPTLDLNVFSEAIEYGFPLQISAKNSGPVYGVLEKELEKLYLKPELGEGLAELDKTVNAEINK